jgi:hypothetical protein
MAKTLQFRRGTTGELSSVTGAVGELFVDTTKDVVVVMDGATPGGFPLQNELVSGTNIKTVNGTSLLGSGDITIAGGGADYDQDLNTTDDVVFNSALVGDVSIIGNQISGVDSYGLADTLVVDGDLDVQGTFTVNGLPVSGSGFSGDYDDLTNKPTSFTNLTLNSETHITGWVRDGAGNILSSGSNSFLTTDGNSVIWQSTKTINGESLLGSGDIVVGGGAGSADQNVNTFDDVVFNSALVGDVSIIGNQISGVDSYGLADTLVVDGNLNVQFGGQSTTTRTISTSDYSFSSYFQYTNSTGEFKLEGNGYLNGTETVATDIPTGSLVTFQSTYGPVVVQLTSGLTYVSGDWIATAVLISGADALAMFGGVAFEFGNNPISVTSTIDTRVNALEVTGTGVNVEGTFTVNGSPVSGGGTTYTEGTGINIVGDVISTDLVSGSGISIAESSGQLTVSTVLKTINGVALEGSGDIVIGGGAGSADQNVNTFDDVVFNSALVGDVSIIGNQISGVDSYGNSDTLVVDGNLNVQFGGQSTTTRTISTSDYSFSSSFRYTTSTGKFVLAGFGYLNGTETVATDIPVGSLVTLTANYGPVVVQLTSGLTYVSFIGEWQADAVLISGADALAAQGNQAIAFVPISVTSTIDIRVNALEVTESGVNVDGTLTVNGQSIDLSTKQDTLVSGTNIKTVNGTSLLGSGDIVIGGGSGASYDQDLNTTDDVVFNSALVGDVSIIGNEISGVDSYGNPDTLVITSDVNISATTEQQITSYILSNYGLGSIWIDTMFSIQGIDNQSDIGQFLNDIVTQVNSSSGGPVTIGVSDSQGVSSIITITTASSYYDGAGFPPGYVYQFTVDKISVEAVGIASISKIENVSVPSNLTVDGNLSVTGTFTVNGQEITSGSGSSYDQDLNTTDDVVFNSALVGNVSIVGNQISGVDSYGLADTLVVDGNLNVQFGEQSTTTQTINPDSYAPGSFFVYTNSTGEFKLEGVYLNGTETVAVDIPTGSLVTFQSSYGPVVVQLTSTLTYVGGNWQADAVVISGADNLAPLGGQVYGDSTTLISVTSTIDTLVTPLEVTETGVNVDGEFTVNGLPVSTASYDQDLNTTDDVVFNSALIGDVSIIGNQISGVDSYGLADTLVVDGDFEVTKQISNTALELTANWTAPTHLDFSSFISTYAPGDPNCYIHTYNTSREYMDYMLARANGGVVNLELTINGDVFTGTVTLGIVADQGSALPFYITAATGGLLAVFSGANSSVEGLVRVYKEENVTTVSTLTPLTVTESGVNVEGTFTVNGQPVSGGSGASYDQDLNTTDDVVFNSALVGDVSIVGNQISGVDSYGLADTLVVDGNLSVEFSSTTSNIVSTTFSGNDGLIEAYVIQATPLSQITVRSSSPTLDNALLAMNVGDSVFIQQTFAGADTFVLTSPFAFDPDAAGGSGGYRAFVDSQFGLSSMGGTTSITISASVATVTTNEVLSVTQTGLSVDGTFTVNGDLEVTGSIINDSTLNVNEDGSKSILFEYPNIIDVTFQTYYSGSNTVQLGSNGFAFNDVGPSSASLIRNIQAGDAIRFTGNNTPSQTYERTVVSIEEFTSAAPQQFLITFSGGTLLHTPTGFTESFITLIEFGTTEYNFGADGTFTVNGQPVAGGADYDQDLNTTDDVVFNSALVGDVSIVGNQISGVDSYGLADTLVVDGNLNVEFSSTSSSVQSTQFFGGAGNDFSFAELEGFTPSSRLIIYSPTPELQSALFNLSIGDSVYILQNSGAGDGTFVLTTTFTFDGSIGSSGGYVALVDSGTSISGMAGTLFIQIPTTVTTSTTTEVLSVTDAGVNVNGALTVNGDLTLADNTITPLNTTSVVKWAEVIVAGQTYYMPLYQ